jgi:hypothetical protein
MFKNLTANWLNFGKSCIPAKIQFMKINSNYDGFEHKTKSMKRKFLNDYTILTPEKEKARKFSIFIKSSECTKAWLVTEDHNI